MTAIVSSFAGAPQALPWYRVVPPFAWLTQPKKPRRLRPAGHSAWVEAMHQPVLFAISLAFTSAGLYTLAKDYVAKAFTSIGAGDYGQIIPVILALFVIVITGASIEIAFLTAASRLRMHLLRKEWGWTTVSAAMLLVTVCVEGLTCSYMFYLIEAPKLSAGFALFMQNVPTLLFFVRAFAGLVCAAYLIIGVLPFVIRPDDVRREMAAEAGAAKVAIIQRLLHVINDLSVWQMLAIYEPVAAIFRDNAGYTSVQGANRLALAALGEVKQQFIAKGAWKPEFEALLAPVEKAHESNAGMELERYDQQTHAALTRLQERLQAVVEAQGQPPGRESIDRFARLEGELQALRDQVVALPAPAASVAPDSNTLLNEWGQRLTLEFGERFAGLEEQIAAIVQGQDAADTNSPDFANSTAAGVRQPGVKALPKPGTKRFNNLVYTTAQLLLGDERMSIFNIAQELQVDPRMVQDAIAALKQERISRLKPGKELDPDPVLDIL